MMNRRQALHAAFLAMAASERPLRSESLKRTMLMSQDLSRIDKDMVISIAQLEYEPAGASEAHRHPGHTFVYVLEGALVAQVDDGPVKTYKPGEMFYEPPMHLHAVSRNASQAEPVKFLVIRVAEKGAPGSVPAK